MPVHILGENNPDCPLCSKPFKRTLYQYTEFLYCDTDGVAIMAKDPFVGHWNNHRSLEDDTEVQCPNPKCRSKMNVFCRQDGYMKAVCSNPKCRAEVETGKLPDGHYDVEKGKGEDILN